MQNYGSNFVLTLFTNNPDLAKAANTAGIMPNCLHAPILSILA